MHSVRGWSPNGDFLTLARYRNPGQPLLQPTKGPTIGSAIDLLDGVDLPDDNMIGYDGRIYVEDGGLPNLGAHLLKGWKDAGGLKQRLYQKASDLTDFSDMIPWFGQSIDAADGEFSLRSQVCVLAGQDAPQLESTTLGECAGHVQRRPCRDDACNGR